MSKAKTDYQRLYDELKTQIVSGVLPPNSRLPSENVLIVEYGITRYMVRKVIEKLNEEKLVYTHQGKGCFVSSLHAGTDVSPSVDTKQILLIASRAEPFYFLKSINGIERALADTGYSLTIKLSNYDPETEAGHLREAFKGDCAGILLFPSGSANLHTNLYLYRYIEEKQIPCITMGNRLSFVQIPYVVTDDYLGGKLAAEYLLQCGHSSFACIMNKEEYSGCMRYAGFVEGINRSDLPAEFSSVIWYNHVEEDKLFHSSSETACSILELTEKVTSFFCFNDSIAGGLCRFLTENGISVPGDISVIGFDDSYLCTADSIKLTSIHQDPEIIGYTAAANLLQLIENREFNGSKIFQPYLAARDSVCSPNEKLKEKP